MIPPPGYRRLDDGNIGIVVEINTKWSIRWIRFANITRYLIGERLAVHVALWGAWKLARMRIAGGRWERLDPKYRPCVAVSSSSTRDASDGG